MKILMSGATGFVGSHLYKKIKHNNDLVKVLTRRGWDETGNSVQWDPEKKVLDPESIEGMDAVVHLSGDGIATGRWSKKKKERILNSRVAGTTFLSETLAQLKNPPKVLVCASAVGYYGDRGADIMTEESSPGQGFLSAVCQAWEKATLPAANKGIRVVNLRFGIILGQDGGALQKMLIPFRLGLGGKMGNGQQYMSWIAIEDVVRIILHAIETPTLSGPVNTVSPSPVMNAEFTATLGHVLCRPALFPVPAFVLKLVAGELAEALFLASTRVDPTKLVKSGYAFKHPQLESALRASV